MVLHLEQPLAVSSFIVFNRIYLSVAHHSVSIEYWVISDLMKSLMTTMPNLEHVERADGQI